MRRSRKKKRGEQAADSGSEESEVVHYYGYSTVTQVLD
jgi:hypothetical protein